MAQADVIVVIPHEPYRLQVALLSCGPLLSSLPLFTRHPLLLEDVAPLLQRTVALPGERGCLACCLLWTAAAADGPLHLSCWLCTLLQPSAAHHTAFASAPSCLLLPSPASSPTARCTAGQVILQQEHIMHCVVFIQKGLVDLLVQASAVAT